jgi:3-oxoacyl-[acyl-carrier protein] reductase
MGVRERRVLITGGQRGIGQALAKHFLEEGCLVTTCARTEAQIVNPQRHRHIIADVSKADDVESLYDQVRADGGLDVLVNNAGIASMNVIALTPVETIQHVMRINAEGTIIVSRAFVRLLRKSAAGRIINMSSIAVPLRLAGEAVYAASKSAVETFTRIAAREFGPMGVTCNAVGPSPIRTALIAGVPEGKLESLVRQQAIPRWATESDVVNVVDFLASERSSMVTGQVIYLGGLG